MSVLVSSNLILQTRTIPAMLDGKNVLCTAETGILHLPIFHTYWFKNCLFLIWLLCRQRGHKHKMKCNWKPRLWWTFFKSNRENICVSKQNFVAGSGKTLSYLLPIIENVLQWNDSCGPPKLRNHPLAIVIVPSHELAEQVQGVVEDTVAQLDVKVTRNNAGRSVTGYKEKLYIIFSV